MNFFSNFLKSKRYLNILNLYKKTFTKEFVLKNYGLFIGDKSAFKNFKIFEILKETKNIKGDIIEFGVWNGNNLILIKKIIEYLNIKKKIIGFDNFRGMPKADENNLFIGDKDLIKYIISFFKFKNIKIIKDDFLNIKRYHKNFNKFSLIYIDCDLYFTTKLILEVCSKNLSIGGLIVFDEGTINGGEAKAAKEFYKKNKKYYKKINLKKNYQPDLIFKKIRNEK